MEMIKKLEEFRRSQNLKKADMSRLFKVDLQNYNNWVYRNSLPKEYIHKAIKLLSENNKDQVHNKTEFPADGYSFANFKKTTIRGSIGSKQVEIAFEDDYTVYPRAYRKQWAEQMALDPEYLHAMEVNGSSMEPSLYQGDTVLINRKSTEPKHGKAFEIVIVDDICIKRLRRRDNAWWVTSDNPAYSKTDLPLEDTMTIIGEAVEKSSVHV